MSSLEDLELALIDVKDLLNQAQTEKSMILQDIYLHNAIKNIEEILDVISLPV